MIALWVWARKVHSLVRIPVDPDLKEPSVGRCDLDGLGIVVSFQVIGCLLFPGQRAIEVICAHRHGG